jgi:SAM-dependent methyltransferase
VEQAVYVVEAQVEADHWWFVGRRALFANEIRKAGIPLQAAVLDVGTGTGSNLRLLRDLGFRAIVGLDPSAEAAHYCNMKGLGPVEQGDVRSIKFADASFDLVLATDVIEHVEDDRQALAQLHRVLRPGGTVLLTVPAFSSLWGLQDDVSHHFRRYRLAQLVQLAKAAGFLPQRWYYFNYLLFVPIWAARQIMRLLRLKLESENELNNGIMNAVLSAIFHFDIATAPVIRPPFGVSAFLLAQKPQS